MEDATNQLSLGDKLRYVYDTARADHANASTLAKLSSVATIGGLGFEWGTGNEALIGLIGGNAHEMTDNSLIAGLAAGGASFAEQTAIGLLMVGTIQSYPQIASAIREITPSRQQNGDQKSSAWNRFLDVIVLGSSVELAKKNAQIQKTKNENIKRVLASSAIIGAANTAIVSAASVSLTIGAENGLESQTETALQFVTNPLTYAGLLAATIGAGKIKKFIQKRQR